MIRDATFLSLLVTVAACGTGRAVPRLVAAPPLPERAVVVELGSPLARSLAIPPLAAEGTYRLLEDPADAPALSGVAIFRGGVEVVADVAAYGGSTRSDAPVHTTDAVAPRQWIGRAVVLDLREKTAQDLDAQLDVDALTKFEAAHGAIGAEDFVVLRTGYAEHLSELRDTIAPRTQPTHSPGFTMEAMRFLVDDRGVRRIATDAPRVGSAADPLLACDEYLFRHGGFAVINLSGLERLPETGATLVVSPLAFKNATSAPARVMALVPRDR